ncbi:hypothetical protein SAMN05421504_11152 [Amycolatopsis xylanica]|uniref:Phage integrase family protein n=1 Tax=Amycolatopsis xylanica TaxID=589385 RepID=A0A1H3RFD8_9PSEU|nr:hypothetical protein [Amycolatopsis xylanica]SDZ24283.1 hypothetical protein SAMN05421504_11152 [Amycolatopsis xylanica]
MPACTLWCGVTRGGGRSAKENFIAAVRCIYRHAENDELIMEMANPARKVRKPRRSPLNRRALSDAALREVNEAAATTGDDPERDSLLRLHSETACRPVGALNLRPRDLDPVQCLAYLREKDGSSRWQPVDNPGTVRGARCVGVEMHTGDDASISPAR